MRNLLIANASACYSDVTLPWDDAMRLVKPIEAAGLRFLDLTIPQEEMKTRRDLLQSLLESAR
jgi:hypothetical protein